MVVTSVVGLDGILVDEVLTMHLEPQEVGQFGAKKVEQVREGSFVVPLQAQVWTRQLEISDEAHIGFAYVVGKTEDRLRSAVVEGNCGHQTS